MKKRFLLINNKRKDEEQMKVFILTDIIHSNVHNYINISVHDLLQRPAPEGQMEAHLPDKQGLDGHPSSILGWGASAL